jgi:hypothetical protein
MFGKFPWRWLVAAAVLAAVECVGVATVELVLTVPAEAQLFDNRYPFLSRPRQPRSGGYFQNLFDPFNSRQNQQQEQPQQYIDHSRAPSPHKPDPKAPPVVPSISIMVMGDGMADWLAYGLEDAFADSPEIGIIRKNKDHSGLLRYETKSQLDWWHVARDLLSKEKTSYVIMMLGVGDRQNIREKDLAKEDDEDKNKGQKDTKDKKGGDKSAQNKGAQNKDAPNKEAPDKDAQDKDDPDNPDRPIVAPEPKQAKKSNGIIEFRSERWEQVYARRIDETVAALKSKGVPVFWVGLPSIRGTKSTADAVYLNDLNRARAARAGAIYVAVWDGFVDEAGKYSNTGPDYEGQMRRLRSGDGVYFTKAGARKLAHFVERELRRYMSSHQTPVALPAGPVGPAPGPGKSAARPLAGPVVPLAMTPENSEDLIGGAGVHAAHVDALANRVLIKGEPVAAPFGRADDFSWPLGSNSQNALTAKSPTDAEAGLTGARTQPVRASATIGQTSQNALEPPRVAQASEKKLPPPRSAAHPPRPPQPVRNNFNNPFGWFR